MAVRIFSLRCLVVLLCCVSPGLEVYAQKATVQDDVDPQFLALHEKALQAKQSGHLFQARDVYLKILSQFADYPGVEGIRREYYDTNVAIIRSPLRTRQSEIYVIKKGDSLVKIARRLGTTVELIKARNQLDSEQIIAGHKLSVWRGAFAIEVDKSENLLTVSVGAEIIKMYPVSTGKNNSTPVGDFVIKHRIAHPVWFHKGEVVPADDPKNFLGTRWLGFDLPKYGIHGTIEPEQIGKSVSSGCIRMRNEDVQELFDLIPVGTKVLIKD